MADMDMQQQLAELARDLQREPTVEDTLQEVAEAACRLVEGCSSAGVSLLARDAPIKTAATTDDIAGRGDKLQVELEEGPCVEAAWEDPLVVSHDLATESRWQEWCSRAVEELGVRSMLCVRLFTHRDRLGALNLYSLEPHAFDEDDIEVARAIAAHASVAVAEAQQDDHFERAMRTRATIGQATGLIMAEHALTADGAFAVLARLSSHQNRKLAVIAREIVAQHETRLAARNSRPSPPPGSRGVS